MYTHKSLKEQCKNKMPLCLHLYLSTVDSKFLLYRHYIVIMSVYTFEFANDICMLDNLDCQENK